MKSIRYAAVVALLTLACSPVYDFSYARASRGLPDTPSLATRVAALLASHEYSELELSPGVPVPMSGESGVSSCPSATEYHVFERPLPYVGYSAVTVHVYKCEHVGRIVIVSSANPWSESAAREARDLIQEELAADIERGLVVRRSASVSHLSSPPPNNALQLTPESL